MASHSSIEKLLKASSRSEFELRALRGVENPNIHMQPWFVYIAIAKTGRYYTGISQNPQQRIKTHNNGRGARFAVEQGPFTLVYVSLPFVSKSDARKREIQIKDWSQAKKQKLILGEWE